jgi:hypothetical protein
MRTAGSVVLMSLVCLTSGCDKKQERVAQRAELKQLTGNTFEIIPAENQLPYCLIFTRSETGTIRQLTMIHGNLSVPCPAGKPVGKVRYRIPVNEGAVKVHVFFSDQRLNAGSIAQDFYERKGDPSFHPMDLRLPGNVYIQSFDFRPQADREATTVGGRIGASGEIVPAEAGAPAAQDAGPEAPVGGSGSAPGAGTGAKPGGATGGSSVGGATGRDAGVR